MASKVILVITAAGAIAAIVQVARKEYILAWAGVLAGCVVLALILLAISWRSTRWWFSIIAFTTTGFVLATALALTGWVPWIPWPKKVSQATSLSTPTAITTPTPTAITTPTPTPASEVLVLEYIDNTGYIDLEGMKVYPGDRPEPRKGVDIAVNARKWEPRNGAGIALSETGGKDTCEQALKRETANYLSMARVEEDKGFCAFSRRGRFAYVELLTLMSQDDDHFATVRLSVYK